MAPAPAASVFRQSGMTIPKLSYVNRHPERLMASLARLPQPWQHADLERALNWAGWSGLPLNRTGLRQVLRLARQNRHSNGYHHPWHTMTVIVLAAILGRRAGLREGEYQSLLLAALVHDLDHRGRHAIGKDRQEERRSVKLSVQMLFSCRAATGVLQRQLQRWIEATSFLSSAAEVRDDRVALILRDADIAGSIFFPMKAVLAMTRGVIREEHHHVGAESKLAEFLEFMAQRGFSHPVTLALAETGRYTGSAAMSAPAISQRLGFRKSA